MLADRVEHEMILLKRHVIVMKKVIEKGPIGIIKLSEETDIPDHKIRYSLRVLEQKGLISPSQHGAVASKSAVELMASFGNEIDRLSGMLNEIRKLV